MHGSGRILVDVVLPEGEQKLEPWVWHTCRHR